MAAAILSDRAPRLSRSDLPDQVRRIVSTALVKDRDHRYQACSSMLRDLRSGQRTEHDHVLGDLLARSRQSALDAPLLGAAYCQMQVRATAGQPAIHRSPPWPK